MSSRQQEIILLLRDGWRLSASPSPEGLYMLYGDTIGQVQHVQYKTVRRMLDACLIREETVLGLRVFSLIAEVRKSDEHI